LYAVRAVHRRLNHAGLDEVDNQLSRWVEKGLGSAAAVQQEAERTRERNQFLRQVFEKASVDKQRPSENDRNTLSRWENEYGMSRDLILLAAEYASGRPSPMDAMNIILKDWAAKGIHNADAARAEHNQHVQAQNQTQKPQTKAAHEEFVRHTDEEWDRASLAAVVDLDGED
jgi:DNA replication protein DnaD